MVAFNCHDFIAVTPFAYAENRFVRHVATGDQEIRLAVRDVRDNQFIVSDDKQVHRGRSLVASQQKREAFSRSLILHLSSFILS